MLKKIVGFFVNQFSERGTEIATFNYALYNEKILNLILRAHHEIPPDFQTTKLSLTEYLLRENVRKITKTHQRTMKPRKKKTK